MTQDLQDLLVELKARQTSGTVERKAYLARRKESREIALRNGGINVNGRIHHFYRVKSLTKVTGSKFRWNVEATVGSFLIEGGRQAGGTSRDWFLTEVGSSKIFGGKHIDCSSLIEALRIIENV